MSESKPKVAETYFDVVKDIRDKAILVRQLVDKTKGRFEHPPDLKSDEKEAKAESTIMSDYFREIRENLRNAIMELEDLNSTLGN